MNETNQFSIYSIFTQKRSIENRNFLVSLSKNDSVEVEVEGMAAFLTATNLGEVEMAYANSLLGILSASDLEIIKKFNPQSNSYPFAHALVAATFGLSESSILSVKDFEKILQKADRDEGDIIDLIAILHSVFQTKESREYIPALVEYIKNNNLSLESSMSKTELVFLVQALYIIWSELFFIPLPSQKIVLSKVFCLSIIMDIPVQSMLEHAAQQQSVNIENYIYYIAFLTEALKSNQEEIETGGKKIIFGSCLEELSNDPKIPEASEKITQCLVLANKIVKGGLLNSNFFDQKDKSQQYAEDMQKLILWFFVRQLWSKIAEYFTNTEPLVPLRVFIRELINHDTLDDENVGRYAEFGAFLQENNLIDGNTSIILFNESTSQFEWNPELLN